MPICSSILAETDQFITYRIISDQFIGSSLLHAVKGHGKILVVANYERTCYQLREVSWCLGPCNVLKIKRDRVTDDHTKCVHSNCIKGK